MKGYRQDRPRAGGPAPRMSPLSSAIVAALALGAGSAAAQPQEGAAALEEIIVTARFREEGIQTTPIAISAFTGEELAVRSIENVEDLGSVIPNAFFRRNTSNFGPNNTIGLRGLNQVDFSYSFEPTVGLYIDDMYHSTVTGSDMDLLDLERVEVLRGPQGTLFGKNSLGGSIRMISRKPQGDNSGSVQATIGSYDRLDVRAVGDFALTERLFTRVVGVTKSREGYGASLDFACEMHLRGTPELAGYGDGVIGAQLANPAAPPLGLPVYEPIFGEPGSPEDNAFSMPMSRDPRQGNCELGKLGGSQSTAGRVMFRYLPTDRLEVNLTAYKTSSDDDPNVDTQLTPRGGLFDTAYDLGVVLPAYGIRYTVDNRFVTGDPYTNYATFGNIVTGATYPRGTTMDARGLSLVADYQIGDNITAKFIVADREYETEWTNDSDRSPFGLIQTHYLQEHEQFQAELQFSGLALNGRLGWTTGAFYFDSSSRAYNTTEFAAFDFTGLLPNFVADDLYSTDNKSAFVHLTYDITERFSVSGGLRYTDESKTNTFQHFGQIVVPEPLRFGDSRTDWKASLEYAVTDNVFVYTQAATGFTSEGATPRIFTIGQLRAIPGEELISYEVGAKMDFLRNRLRVNTAFYYSDYDPRSIQVGGVTQCDDPMDPDPFPYRLSGGNCPEGTALAGTTGLAWFYYDNVPGTLQGFELELTASPIDDLLITYSAGQNSYKNDDLDISSATYRHPKFRSQPEWNMSLGAQYTLRLGNGGTFTPRLDAFYQGDRHIGPAGARPGIHGVVANVCPEQCIPAYTLLNARLTYASPEGDWRVSLSGTNLTDKFYWQQVGPALTVNATTGAIGTPTDRSGVASRPREWALSLEKRFQ
jgi:iron complex outermembrane recepter protein